MELLPDSTRTYLVLMAQGTARRSTGYTQMIEIATGTAVSVGDVSQRDAMPQVAEEHARQELPKLQLEKRPYLRGVF